MTGWAGHNTWCMLQEPTLIQGVVFAPGIRCLDRYMGLTCYGMFCGVVNDCGAVRVIVCAYFCWGGRYVWGLNGEWRTGK